MRAILMSLLFCKASSRARFSVSEMAAGACCAGTAAANDAAKMRIAPALRSESMEFTLRIKAYETLLVTQGFNRLQLRRVICGKIAEKQARRTGHSECNHHAHGRYRNPQITGKKKLRGYGNSKTDQDSNHCSASADQKRFHKKLVENIFPRRTNRLSDAYFPRALLHRHQHNVHDANPADKKGDERDDEQHNRQCEGNVSRCHKDCGERLHIVFRLGRVPAS